MSIEINNERITSFEIDLLLKTVSFRYGYDFSNYAQASLTRRICSCMSKNNIPHISLLIPKLLHEPDFFLVFLKEMSVTVTEMFRDPHVFKTIKNTIFTQLKTYSRINIWHAGCATGEEVYSIAIMLQEAKLLNRCQLYATDYNDDSLEIAEHGSYNVEKIPNFTRNYIQAGGESSFADYYRVKHGNAELDPKLKQHITFAKHNLIKDQVFAQMHLIICRNVLIYFDNTLQNKVIKLFKESLLHRGYLVLGNKESINFSDQSCNFTAITKGESIYQKVCYD